MEINKKSKFIDIHTHGAFGVNFNNGTLEQIKFVLKEFYKRNIVAICPTLVGDNNENIQRQLAIFKRIKEEDSADECKIIGAHLEGTFLSPNKAGIQNPSVFKIPNVENFKNFVGNFESIIKIVTIAPELDEGLIDYLNKNNIITQAGHSLGGDLKNSKGITHLFNAMKPIHHRDSSIALNALIDDNIYVEVIGDLIHLSKDILKLILKTKPKNRIMLISDSLPCAHSKENIIFCGKEINENGCDSNGTLAGSCRTIDEIAQILLENKILTKDDIDTMAYKNQIEYLNILNG